MSLIWTPIQEEIRTPELLLESQKRVTQPSVPTVKPEFAGHLWLASANKLPVASGTPVFKANKFGMALQGDGASWFSLPRVINLDSTAKGLTFVFVGCRNTGVDTIFAGTTDSSNSFLRFENANMVNARLGSDIYFIGAYSTETPNAYVLRAEKGATSVKRLYVGGTLKATSAVNNHNSFILRNIGAGYSGGALALNGQLNMLHIIPYDIGYELACNISANPWSIFL